MKPLLCLMSLILLLTFPGSTQGKQANRSLLLEVILTTWDIQRTETLVYLRVYSDGYAEAHPSYEVDFRTLALKHAEVPSADLNRLRELLDPSKIRGLKDKYERSWGAVDTGSTMVLTIGQGEDRNIVTLLNFQPFLARKKKQPYPAEIEKLGCIIWELRQNLFKEPLGKDWVRGCREWGY